MNTPILRAAVSLCLAALMAASCSRREEDTAVSSREPSLPSSRPKIAHAVEGSPALAWAAAIDRNGSEWTARFREASTPAEKAEVIDSKLSSGPENLGSLLKQAMLESSESLRLDAVQAAATLVETAEIVDILTAATYDSSEEVRAHAFDMIQETRNSEAQFRFFKTALTHPDRAIKEEAMLELGRYSTPEAFEIMLEGLKDPDSAFRAVVNDHLAPFASQEFPGRTFDTYDEARQWWNFNRKHFDEHMTFVDE